MTAHLRSTALHSSSKGAAGADTCNNRDTATQVTNTGNTENPCSEEGAVNAAEQTQLKGICDSSLIYATAQ